MGQVSPLGKIKSHEGVARFQTSHLDSQIGLGAGVRLDVGIFSIVELAEAIDGQLLNLVDDFAASVVTLSRVTLRVLVGADGAHGFHHLVCDIIFRSDQLQSGRLAFFFFLDQIKNLNILFHIV